MQIANSIWRIVKSPSDLRLLISGLCVMLFALGVSASAQQPKKISVIGYLSALSPAAQSTRSEMIRQTLRELG